MQFRHDQAAAVRTQNTSRASLDPNRPEIFNTDGTGPRPVASLGLPRPIIEVMIDLAQKLGFRITVEGIETAAQSEYFQRRGEMLLQGYHFGMPGSDAALLTTINRSSDDSALINS